MNRFHKKIIIACLAITSVSNLYTLPKQPSQKMMGANPYTWSPRYFNAENGITGRYWAGNGTKKYPGKAFIEDIEYKDIVVIKKSLLKQKSKIKLRKNKDYLGFYIDAATNIKYCLYGVKKKPDPVDNGPDSDVLTQIAIKLDYGIEG